MSAATAPKMCKVPASGQPLNLVKPAAAAMMSSSTSTASATKKHKVPADGKKHGLKKGISYKVKKTTEDWYNQIQLFTISLAQRKSRNNTYLGYMLSYSYYIIGILSYYYRNQYCANSSNTICPSYIQVSLSVICLGGQSKN